MSLETHFDIKSQSNSSPKHLLGASPRPKLVSGRLSPLFRSSGAASKTYVFLKETIDFPFSEGGRNVRPAGNPWGLQCALSPRPPIPSKDRTFPIPYPPVSPTRRPALRGRRIDWPAATAADPEKKRWNPIATSSLRFRTWGCDHYR